MANSKHGFTPLSVTLYLVAATVLFGGAYGAWYVEGVRHVEEYRATGKDLSEAGQYGDSFGRVNALFSGLAFAGVVFAIILQTIELRYQREELEDTREELRKSADAQNQLVTLNALAAISQHLQSIYAPTYVEADAEFWKALQHTPERAKGTIRFKLEACTLVLAKVYEKYTGESLNSDELLLVERRKYWLTQFGYIVQTFDGNLENIKALNGHQQSDTLRKNGGEIVRRLREACLWMDCLNDPDRKHYETLSRLEQELSVAAQASMRESALTDDEWATVRRIRQELFDTWTRIRHDNGL